MTRSPGQPTPTGWDDTLLDAALLAGVSLVFLTELLGAFEALNRLGSLATLALIALLVGRWRRRQTTVTAQERGRMTRGDRAVAWALVSLVGIVMVVGLASGPSNNDVLSYHLPRVMHWLQNESVDHYPTDIERQLFLGPFPEYVVMHVVAITGTDRLTFVAQWFAWAGCGVAVANIARHKSIDRSGQLLTASFALTVPMAVLQAASAQTDLVTALWCLVAVAASVRPGPWGARALRFGAAAALAMLSKPTAALFLLVPALWLSHRAVRCGRRSGVIGLATGLALALALMAPWAIRNVATFGHPAGPMTDRIAPTRVSVESTASTALRNLAVQVPPLEGGVTGLHDELGWDAGDPRSTWENESFRAPQLTSSHEEHAPAPVHVALLAIASVIALAQRRFRLFAATYWVGFVAFSALLRWQPWHNRLLLPLIMMGAPLVVLLVRTPPLRRAVAACMLLLALPHALTNHTRPLVRPDGILTTAADVDLFRRLPDLRADYEDIGEMIGTCNEIQVSATEFSWEYPLWRLVGAGPFGSSEVRYRWPASDEPCAHVHLEEHQVWVELIPPGGQDGG